MRTKGHRIGGAFSGLMMGLGLAILLQQFAVVALTLPVVLGLPLGFMLIGIAVGWPRKLKPV